MKKEEKKVAEKVEEVVEETIINGKLYGVWNIISNKTVRQNEKHLVRYHKSNKECKGFLCKTGRGYFIDGYNVDRKAVSDWAAMNNGLRVFVPSKKKA